MSYVFDLDSENRFECINKLTFNQLFYIFNFYIFLIFLIRYMLVKYYSYNK